MTKFLKLVAIGYWDNFLQSERNLAINLVFLINYGEPSRVNQSFRSPQQARGGIFLDHVTLFFRSHDQNRTASDSNFQRQFYHSIDFDSKST